jgi:hypothetical protein
VAGDRTNLRSKGEQCPHKNQGRVIVFQIRQATFDISFLKEGSYMQFGDMSHCGIQRAQPSRGAAETLHRLCDVGVAQMCRSFLIG